ncbi:hypothetical protein BKA65DRAFT_589506 [Rhexocercosporidium sp. MPI-PUGE-AT-0058]|nr:hypothetical protein BKA65DRAFT_589506 [Rhexocercosporidium sp. MPI-PUGE-AT-0058]
MTHTMHNTNNIAVPSSEFAQDTSTYDRSGHHCHDHYARTSDPDPDLSSPLISPPNLPPAYGIIPNITDARSRLLVQQQVNVPIFESVEWCVLVGIFCFVFFAFITWLALQ